MDPYLLLATKAASLRHKLAVDAEAPAGAVSRLGGLAMQGGALGAGAGFGGGYAARQYLSAHPIASAAHSAQPLTDQLKAFFTGKPPAIGRPLSRMDVIKFLARRGNLIGGIGAGVAAAGLPAFMAGRQADRAHAEAKSLRELLAARSAPAQAAPPPSPPPPSPAALPALDAREGIRPRGTPITGHTLANLWSRFVRRGGQE